MTQVVMNKQKTIALIAHDHQKEDLVEWCVRNQEELKKHFLCGTGTTSKMIAEATGLPVKPYKSGPLGGDQQIGARIAEGEIDMMIFFWDPLEAQPHDPVICGYLICVEYIHDKMHRQLEINGMTVEDLTKSIKEEKER